MESSWASKEEVALPKVVFTKYILLFAEPTMTEFESFNSAMEVKPRFVT